MADFEISVAERVGKETITRHFNSQEDYDKYKREKQKESCMGCLGGVIIIFVLCVIFISVMNSVESQEKATTTKRKVEVVNRGKTNPPANTYSYRRSSTVKSVSSKGVSKSSATSVPVKSGTTNDYVPNETSVPIETVSTESKVDQPIVQEEHSSVIDYEPEKELSRKERKALKKAQKQAEKAAEQTLEMDDLYGF